MWCDATYQCVEYHHKGHTIRKGLESAVGHKCRSTSITTQVLHFACCFIANEKYYGLHDFSFAHDCFQNNATIKAFCYVAVAFIMQNHPHSFHFQGSFTLPVHQWHPCAAEVIEWCLYSSPSVQQWLFPFLLAK